MLKTTGSWERNIKISRKKDKDLNRENENVTIEKNNKKIGI